MAGPKMERRLSKWNVEKAFDFRAVVAEFVAMFLFVLICCGAATGVAGTPGWVQQISLTFGFCITCLAYTVGHHSGAQINCAVTFALALAKQVTLKQALGNFAGQMLGSLAGAAYLALLIPAEADLTGGLGANTVSPRVENWMALLAEVAMTFLLVYVVMESAVNPRTKDYRINAPIAIGLAVYLAHSILIPVDGCSINPSRSFGPAVVASIRYSSDAEKVSGIWKDHWVFWLGPLAGAALAVAVYQMMRAMDPAVSVTSERSEKPVDADLDLESEAAGKDGPKTCL